MGESNNSSYAAEVFFTMRLDEKNVPAGVIGSAGDAESGVLADEGNGASPSCPAPAKADQPDAVNVEQKSSKESGHSTASGPSPTKHSPSKESGHSAASGPSPTKHS